MEADWTSATRMGEVVSVVISQAAATSFIHMQVLAATQVSHSMRNAGTDNGASGEREAVGAAAGALSSSGGVTAASLPWAGVARSAAGSCAGSGGGVGATLRVLSWDGNGRMSADCATACPAAQPRRGRPGPGHGHGVPVEKMDQNRLWRLSIKRMMLSN